MHVYGIQWLLHKRNHESAVEGCLIVAHSVLYLTAVLLVLSPLKALAFIVVQQSVFSIYLGCSFAPNHKGMPTIDADAKMTFAQRQVITARNVVGGRFTNFMLGGLNYQIEHHLFPTMPRPNLAEHKASFERFASRANSGTPRTLCSVHTARPSATSQQPVQSRLKVLNPALPWSSRRGSIERRLTATSLGSKTSLIDKTRRQTSVRVTAWPARARPANRPACRSILESRLLLSADAVAVFASGPAARSALAFHKFLPGPANAALPGRLLFGSFDPADELIAGQRRDVLPCIECLRVSDQRAAQVSWKLVHYSPGHLRLAHTYPT